MNDIARITLKLAQPVVADRYADNRATGAFIIIDEHQQHRGRGHDRLTPTHFRSKRDPGPARAPGFFDCPDLERKPNGIHHNMTIGHKGFYNEIPYD